MNNKSWYCFFDTRQWNKSQFYMSQDRRIDQRGGREIRRTASEGIENKGYEGFEGMNYEQYRQPYNRNHTDRINSIDQRRESKRPDES